MAGTDRGGTAVRALLCRVSTLSNVVRFVWAHPGNRGARGRALARLVAWQAWERAVRRPWTIDVAGLRMRCHPHSAGASGVLYCRLPEWEDMRFAVDFLRPGDVFVDVGANVGVYSLLAAGVGGTDVFAFEPSSPAYDRLCENVALNHIESQVRTVRAAVGAMPGRARMTTGLDTVNRVVGAGDGHAFEEVELVTLDVALGPEWVDRVTLIKVDVEGYEDAVLRGATAILGAAAPALIVEANEPAVVGSILEPFGYQPFTYDPARQQLTRTAWDTPGRHNILAMVDPTRATNRLQTSSDEVA